jgi:hypothetical protein
MTRWMTGFTALFLTGVASAQEPIVGIKVTPQKSVFKDSAWNKPLMIKSKEDAVRHFGKDAIERLGKEVDFKKQFLLVFAWRGSGGDKLTYAVAESFPEQIFFSLTPGSTRDLREHTHVFALRSDVSWSAKGGTRHPNPSTSSPHARPTGSIRPAVHTGVSTSAVSRA